MNGDILARGMVELIFPSDVSTTDAVLCVSSLSCVCSVLYVFCVFCLISLHTLPALSAMCALTDIEVARSRALQFSTSVEVRVGIVVS